MSDDAQQQITKGEEGQSPSAKGYNPNAHGAPHGSPSGNNLVRDLMSVYESLTQSKTPQIPSQHSSYQDQQQAPPLQHHHYAPPPQHHPQYPPQHAPPAGSNAAPEPQQGGGTFVIPPNPYQVPPPPPYPPAQPGAPPSQAPPYYPDPSSYGQHPYSVVPAPQQGSYAHPGSSQPPGPSSSADKEEDDGDDSEGVEDRGSRGGQRKRRGSDVSSNSGKGSAATKSRKKSKKSSDGRWSKRFTWPEDLHRDFVSAIFDVGLKHSSPSTILEHMPKHEQITAERIKSHLQKYRMHRLKSKKEFISSYESSLRNFQARGLSGVKSISSGEVAAHLTYSTIGDAGVAMMTAGQKSDGETNPLSTTTTGNSSTGDGGAKQQDQNDALTLPQLTDAEKQSPIGAAMGYLMGLFFSLKQQLDIQRANEDGKKLSSKNNAPVQAVFNSFVTGNAGAQAPTDSGQSTYPSAAGHPSSQAPQPQAFDQAVAKPASVLSAPSVRTNIEENSIMKQEMQNQMALQNKMRALKQQELNKYKTSSSPQSGEEAPDQPPAHHHVQHSSMLTKEDESTAVAAQHSEASEAQGAGEPPGNDAKQAQRLRDQSLSIGASDEFWNTDVVDDQLFEFLMNN